MTNKLTNNDRSIVSDVAGTTRDAIDTMVEHEGQFYTIVDTAGLRKKSVIDEDVEYYGFVRAMRAIDRAEVVLLVIDSTIGLTDQDQRVAGMAAERGCAMVVVLNKWDLVEGPDAKAEVRERIEDRLKFVGYAPVIAISALSGKNVQRIWGAISNVLNCSKSISSSRLNNEAPRIFIIRSHHFQGQAYFEVEVRYSNWCTAPVLYVFLQSSRPGRAFVRALSGKQAAFHV